MRRLTELREARGITRAELAKLCSWSPSLQTKLEKGDIALKERQIRKLAEVLEVHPGELFEPLPIPSLADLLARLPPAQRRSIEITSLQGDLSLELAEESL